MIILIHGTGDDNSKPENWISWVAQIMEKHGEMTLAIPGVASDEQNLLGVHVSQFFMKLGQGPVHRRTSEANIAKACPGLVRALRTAGGELARAINVPAGQEEKIANYLIANKREEGGVTTSGIKIRVALIGLCAVAYYRRCPPAQFQPIRIIGHSRGGSVAVGVHNLLSSYGIPCNYTLTLDPCHGLKKPRNQKEYFHKIWAGSLINVPVVKGVGKNWAGFAVFRPPITTNNGVAHVTNHPKLKKIKHGHMGKLQSLPDGQKAQMRAALTQGLKPLVDQKHPDARAHLNEFFVRGTRKGTPDYRDRVFIQSKVIEALTT